MAPPSPSVSTFTGDLAALPTWLRHVLADIQAEDVHGMISTLDNEIDPIFDFHQWTGVDAGLYVKMRPALQLASLFLTDDRALDWFYHDSIGKLEWETINDDQAWSYVSQNHDLEDYPENRHLLREVWLAKLDSLRSIMRFFFFNGQRKLSIDIMGCMVPFASDLEKNKDDGDILSGNRLYEESGEWKCIDSRWPYTGDEITEPGIMISDMFKESLEQDDQVCYLNCCFSLGITLVHEMAHAAHSWPRFRYIDQVCKYYGEAFSSRTEMIETVAWGTVEPPEAGFSWERSVFGGVKGPDPTTQLVRQVRELDGISLSPFRLLKRNSGPREITICSSKDIARWFQKESWHASRQASEVMSPFQELRYLRW